ncbi:MAG: hypothetical protein RL705_775 [Bacteroidota bacterium]
MKSIVTLLILFLSNMAINAQSELTIFKIKVDEETITYQFSSVKDFEENYEKYLQDFEHKEKRKEKQPLKLFWIEISVILSSEKENTLVSRSIYSSETTLKEDLLNLKKYIFSLLAIL